MDYISFPTALAANYLDTNQAAMTAAVRRNGEYRGIEPLKDAAGRYHWPADAVREAALPPVSEQPDGAPLFVKVVSHLAPGVEPKDAYLLALGLLGSEAKSGWKPKAGQTPESIQHEEFPLSLLIVQATLDRVDSYVNGALDRGARDFARVLSERLKNLAIDPDASTAGESA